MNRPVYRKWQSMDDHSENFLMIDPVGIMLQISFEKDGIYGRKATLYQTSRLNPLDENVFRKHKEVCSKSEWSKAQKEIIKLVKGELIPSAKKKAKK